MIQDYFEVLLMSTSQEQQDSLKNEPAPVKEELLNIAGLLEKVAEVQDNHDRVGDINGLRNVILNSKKENFYIFTCRHCGNSRLLLPSEIGGMRCHCGACEWVRN